MSCFLLILFLAVLLRIVWQGICEPKEFLQYPNLFASCFLLFIGLQSIILVFNPVVVSERVLEDNGVELVIVMFISCVLAGIWGYRTGMRCKVSVIRRGMSDRFLFGYGLLLVAIGLIGAYKMAQFFGGFSNQFLRGAHYTVWSGKVVQYNFWVSFMYPGVFMIFFSTVNSFSRRKLFFLIPALVYPLMTVFLLGRRYQMFYLAMMVVSCIGLLRGRYPKRLFLIGGYCVAVILLIVVPVLRTRQLNPDSTRSFSASEIVYAYFREGRGAEVKAAMTAVAGSFSLGEYNMGMSIYDMFIFNYVPASIWGAEFKLSLLTGINDRISDDIADRYGEDKDLGTFRTGPGSVFMMFGFLGAFLYFIQGAWFGRLWKQCQSNFGDDFLTLKYALMLPSIFLGVVFCFEQMIIYVLQVTVILFPLYLNSRFRRKEL